MNEQILMAALKLYEEKLMELMPEDEYRQFAEKVARMTFFAEVCASPNDDYKRLVFEHWDEITAPVDTYDHCWESGEYDGQDCALCPYNDECSGSEVE